MTGVVNIAINGNTGSIDRALGKTDKKVDKIVGSFNDMGKASKKVGESVKENVKELDKVSKSVKKSKEEQGGFNSAIIAGGVAANALLSTYEKLISLQKSQVALAMRVQDETAEQNALIGIGKTPQQQAATAKLLQIGNVAFGEAAGDVERGKRVSTLAVTTGMSAADIKDAALLMSGGTDVIPLIKAFQSIKQAEPDAVFKRVVGKIATAAGESPEDFAAIAARSAKSIVEAKEGGISSDEAISAVALVAKSGLSAEVAGGSAAALFRFIKKQKAEGGISKGAGLPAAMREILADPAVKKQLNEEAGLAFSILAKPGNFGLLEQQGGLVGTEAQQAESFGRIATLSGTQELVARRNKIEGQKQQTRLDNADEALREEIRADRFRSKREKGAIEGDAIDSAGFFLDAGIRGVPLLGEGVANVLEREAGPGGAFNLLDWLKAGFDQSGRTGFFGFDPFGGVQEVKIKNQNLNMSSQSTPTPSGGQ